MKLKYFYNCAILSFSDFLLLFKESHTVVMDVSLVTQITQIKQQDFCVNEHIFNDHDFPESQHNYLSLTVTEVLLFIYLFFA